MLLTRQRTTYSYDNTSSEELQLSLYPRAIELPRVREIVQQAYARSPQLGILVALYHYSKMDPRGARPRDLHGFLSKLGIPIRDNYLRAELSYLAKKGLVVKKGERYRIREDLRLEDLERLVDIKRSRAGREKWFGSPRVEDWRPKHSIEVAKLIQVYNLHNLISHIKALIKKNEPKVLATLLYFGEGLRPSDKVVELGFKESSFYAVVYEPKLDRYRLVCEECDRLWCELLKDEEIRQWLLEMTKRYSNEWLQWPWEQKYRWKVPRDEWDLIASRIRKSTKRIARRVYLAYQYPSGRATVLALKNGRPLIAGMHLDSSNDLYYIER